MWLWWGGGGGIVVIVKDDEVQVGGWGWWDIIVDGGRGGRVGCHGGEEGPRVTGGESFKVRSGRLR